MSSGLGNLVQGCCLSHYWFLRGPASLLCHPLFCIQTCSLGGLAEILWTISHEVVRTTTPKTISSFLLIQLNCIGIKIKLLKLTGWYAPPIPFKVSGSSSEDSASSSPSGFTLESSSVPMLSTSADRAVKVWLPFSFLEGKQIPQCLWLGNTWSSSQGGLQEQGISSFCLFSNFQTARSRSE